jgi:L-ribulose-5-phosphate 4-epimerase
VDFVSLREEVWWANRQLPERGLVAAHSGNASGLHPDTGLVLIKPSGVDYDRLRPEDLAVVTLDGHPAPADAIPDRIVSSLRPSVDTPHHLALFRADPGIGGVVHTHSSFATAWAAVARSVPCALTAMADEFGGEIPCAPYADNEGDHIGEAILRHRTRAPGVLLANHGVFAFGTSARAALKAATMIEDAAKTMWLARQLGEPTAIDPDEIEKWWTRYHATYGQEPRSELGSPP